MASRRSNSDPKPVTAERIERSLDRVAEIIVQWGKEGEVFLPLYEYLDKALADYQAKADTLSAAHARFKRSKDRTAARSC